MGKRSGAVNSSRPQLHPSCCIPLPMCPHTLVTSGEAGDGPCPKAQECLQPSATSCPPLSPSQDGPIQPILASNLNLLPISFTLSPIKCYMSKRCQSPECFPCPAPRGGSGIICQGCLLPSSTILLLLLRCLFGTQLLEQLISVSTVQAKPCISLVCELFQPRSVCQPWWEAVAASRARSHRRAGPC